MPGLDEILPIIQGVSEGDWTKGATTMTELPPGKYYVGDLCYVLKPQNGWSWDEVLDATGSLGLSDPNTGMPYRAEEETPGYFEVNGVRFFCSGTAYGDGCYLDNMAREYSVDAGIIGCFPLNALNHPEGGDPKGAHLGHIVEFSRAFHCHTCDENGAIRIGNVTIWTGMDDEWE